MAGGPFDVVTRACWRVGDRGERALPLAEQEREARAGGFFPIPTTAVLELGEERRRHRFRVAAGTERRDEDVGSCGECRPDLRDGPFALDEHIRDGGVVVE